MTERERQNSSLRTYESDLHAMEKNENSLSNQIRDKDLMEERIKTMTTDIAALNAKLKVRTPTNGFRDRPYIHTLEHRNWTPKSRKHKHL